MAKTVEHMYPAFAATRETVGFLSHAHDGSHVPYEVAPMVVIADGTRMFTGNTNKRGIGPLLYRQMVIIQIHQPFLCSKF